MDCNDKENSVDVAINGTNAIENVEQPTNNKPSNNNVLKTGGSSASGEMQGFEEVNKQNTNNALFIYNTFIRYCF